MTNSGIYSLTFIYVHAYEKKVLIRKRSVLRDMSRLNDFQKSFFYFRDTEGGSNKSESEELELDDLEDLDKTLHIKVTNTDRRQDPPHQGDQYVHINKTPCIKVTSTASR